MAQVTRRDDRPANRDEQIRVLVALGMSEEQARFVLAVSAGEIDGDVVIEEAPQGRPS